MTTVHLQPNAPREGREKVLNALPSAWEGTWKGVCQLDRTDGTRCEFAMELRIASPDSAGIRSWRIVYQDGLWRQEREHSLEPVLEDASHLVLDQGNGVQVDQYLVGDVLHAQQQLPGALIASRFELCEAGIEVEMVAYRVADARSSASHGKSMRVRSFGVRSVQRGRLVRPASSG